MPQPHNISEFSDFLPKKDRRTPLPLTSLPHGGMSEDADPTLEIRTLIEQLQQSARDARSQARTAEQEKDEIANELARAQHQIDALRANELELRSHFVEVNSLIRERDAALRENERRSGALAEATQRYEETVRERHEAQRQRDEAIRHREETTRKFEVFQRAAEENARVIAETQRQLLSIRQARDGAHSQILELNNKLGRAEDQIAELEYVRDAAQKAAKQAQAEVSDYRRQLDTVASDRDATARQIEHLIAELDAQREKFFDLAEQESAALQADGEHAAALAEARSLVARLTDERDAARTRGHEQAHELEELRQQFETFRNDESRDASGALAEAHEKLAALESQAREARHAANNLRQQLLGVNEQLAALQEASAGADARQSNAQQQLEALSRDREGTLTLLTSAQKQIEHIILDRDRVRELAKENASELSAQVTALQAQVATFETAVEEATAQKEQLTDLTARFEQQRLESIDLATQLQAAQREIRELSASLAEARLQVKFANAASRAARNGTTKSDFASLLAEPAGIVEDAPVVRPAPLALGIEDALSDKEIKSALGAMRHCFQSFTKTPADRSLLNELHCHVHGFSERARASNLIGIHRLCSALSELTRGLYEIPERSNPSTLRTVQQTIEFLGTLMKEKDLALVRDPATALIYAVDDDLGNCESIALAMEESMMRTSYAQDPAVGLAELAGGRFDLIFLDVNMPGMDGFELCKKIRTLANHATTPVVFLTGLATLENRVQSSLSGGNDFIGKPFNLYELSVKAITLILKAHLKIG
jgi:CheY-like chemotaxis protein/chromosome segregation ATPase